jgi:hypothetical protein
VQEDHRAVLLQVRGRERAGLVRGVDVEVVTGLPQRLERRDALIHGRIGRARRAVEHQHLGRRLRQRRSGERQQAGNGDQAGREGSVTSASLAGIDRRP